MRFPEETREGSQGHADALRRLHAARDDERNLSQAMEGSTRESSGPAASTKLAAARENTAAREAWVDWVERGY